MPLAAGFPNVERRDIIVEDESVQDNHLHKSRTKARRRWWLLEIKAGKDCSIVGPSLRPQPVTGSVSGHPGSVDRRLLLLPGGGIALGPRKSFRFLMLAETAGAQAGRGQQTRRVMTLSVLT